MPSPVIQNVIIPGHQVLFSDEFEFVSTKKEDQGHYTCTAKNNIGNDQNTNINIEGLTLIQHSLYFFQIGQISL